MATKLHLRIARTLASLVVIGTLAALVVIPLCFAQQSGGGFPSFPYLRGMFIRNASVNANQHLASVYSDTAGSDTVASPNQDVLHYSLVPDAGLSSVVPQNNFFYVLQDNTDAATGSCGHNVSVTSATPCQTYGNFLWGNWIYGPLNTPAFTIGSHDVGYRWRCQLSDSCAFILGQHFSGTQAYQWEGHYAWDGTSSNKSGYFSEIVPASASAAASASRAPLCTTLTAPYYCITYAPNFNAFLTDEGANNFGFTSNGTQWISATKVVGNPAVTVSLGDGTSGNGIVNVVSKDVNFNLVHNLNFTGNSLSVFGKIQSTGDAIIGGNSTIAGTLGVTGGTTLGTTSTGALTASSATIAGVATLKQAAAALIGGNPCTVTGGLNITSCTRLGVGSYQATLAGFTNSVCTVSSNGGVTLLDTVSNSGNVVNWTTSTVTVVATDGTVSMNCQGN